MPSQTMDRLAPTLEYLPAGADRLLTEAQAAELLSLKPATLRRWRSVGEPKQPDFVKIGRACRYRLSTLLEYIGTLETGGGVR